VFLLSYAFDIHGSKITLTGRQEEYADQFSFEEQTKQGQSFADWKQILWKASGGELFLKNFKTKLVTVVSVNRTSNLMGRFVSPADR